MQIKAVVVIIILYLILVSETVMMNKYLKISEYITNIMKKKFIINISEKKSFLDETDNYKYF